MRVKLSRVQIHTLPANGVGAHFVRALGKLILVNGGTEDSKATFHKLEASSVLELQL